MALDWEKPFAQGWFQRPVSPLRRERADISDHNLDRDSVGGPDWFFTVGDSAEEAPAAVTDALEFARATLSSELEGMRRTARHLQELMRRAHAEGVGRDALAVHSGLAIETVDRVLSGTALVELLTNPGSGSGA